jgi:hypothetical protein
MSYRLSDAATTGTSLLGDTRRVKGSINTLTAGNNITISESGGTITVGAGTKTTETVTATNVITAAETGTTFFLSSATEFVSTLPAPAAGLEFEFFVAAAPSGASYTIVTNGGDNIIVGHVVSSEDAAGSGDFEASGGDTITLVDSKAVVGDRVRVISDGTNWFMTAYCSVQDAITITTAA